MISSESKRLAPRREAEETVPQAGYLFSSMPRSDQRRWAEIFVRGLLSVPGRKSIRKISDHVAGGGVEQCLQQFVSQSTWRWDTVRCDLASWLSETLEPSAWVIEEAVLPKNGNNSVGVGRQFACTEGRVLNCQLGVAVFLAGNGWSCPVNWRLALPPVWDEDKERRKKAHLPDGEHCVPRWQHMVDALDEMTVEWGLRPLPVIADMSQQAELDPLLSSLEERHVPYVIRVGPNQPAVTVRSAQGALRTLSYAQFVGESLMRNTATLNVWALPADRPGRVQLIGTRIPADVRSASAASGLPSVIGGRPRGPRYIVAEWLSSRRSPRTAWVTSSGPRQIHDLMAAASLDRQAAADLDEIYDDLGLRHFEGRSFAGWHHYATLASVACGCRLASRTRVESRRTA